MGNKIPYLLFQAKKECKIIGVAIARQHPGEAVASWVMDGFLGVLGDGRIADFVTWVVVPMVNVDGVVLGNNRTGVLGHDFNRNWVDDVSNNSRYPKLFPEIAAIMSLVKNLRKKHPKKVKLFLDFHGHSSQPNVFSYGPPHQQQSQYFFQCRYIINKARLLPQLIAKRNPNFKLNQCSYVLHAEKKKTARAIFFYNLSVPFTYTIQSSFGLFNEKNATIDDFVKVGQDVAIAANQFLGALGAVGRDGAGGLGGLGGLIQDIKLKYANAQNQGEEFESASQISDEDPSRKKIQEMVIADQQIPPQTKTIETTTTKSNKRYEQPKDQQNVESQQKCKSLGKNPPQKQSRAYSTSKRTEKRRISTEVELAVNRKQCIFPNIATKNSKVGFDQVNLMSSEEILQNLKLDDIQKRLYRLRNSKIGKKILVINAYCS